MLIQHYLNDNIDFSSKPCVDLIKIRAYLITAKTGSIDGCLNFYVNQIHTQYMLMWLLKSANLALMKKDVKS